MSSSIELSPEDLPNRFKQMGGVPAMWGLAEKLQPTPGYAQKPIDQAFIGYSALLKKLAARPGNAEDAIVTAFYGARKRNLSETLLYSLELRDVRAFDIAINNGALSYSRGHVLDDREITDEIPYIGLEFSPTSMSSCVFPNEIMSRASASHPVHREAVVDAREWFDAAAIVQARPRLERDAGGAVVSATLDTICVRQLFG